jgi:hypothetical protein
MARLNATAAPVNRISGSAAHTSSFPASPAPVTPGAANLTYAGYAALWHALAQTAGEEAVRDDLPSESLQVVSATISGQVNGQEFRPLNISAVLTVGQDSQQASTVTPEVPHLIAAILAKLNAKTRDSVLRDLPNEFAAAGCELPEVTPDLMVRTNAILRRLRAKQLTAVRGSVACQYSVGLADAG